MPAYQVTFEFYLNNHLEGKYQVMIPEYLKRVCDETNDYKTSIPFSEDERRFRHTLIQKLEGVELLDGNDHPTEEEYQMYSSEVDIPSLFYQQLMSVWGFLLTEQLEQGYFEDQDQEDENIPLTG